MTFRWIATAWSWLILLSIIGGSSIVAGVFFIAGHGWALIAAGVFFIGASTLIWKGMAENG